MISPQCVLSSLTSNIEEAHLDIALCPMGGEWAKYVIAGRSLQLREDT